MALWQCVACGTLYSVGATGCPHCHSRVYREDGMPKITAHGGPSNKADHVHEIVVFEKTDFEAHIEECEDPECLGSSSSPSTVRPTTTSPKNEPVRRKPARTTGSRSAKARTGSSSAPSTDGVGKESDD